MKKLTVLFALLVLTVFSATAAENYLQFDFSVPIRTTKDQTKISIAPGFSYRAMFNNFLGLYIAGDFIVPMKYTPGEDPSQYINLPMIPKTISKRSEFPSDWLNYGFDFMVGVALVPINKDVFKLLVAPSAYIEGSFQGLKKNYGEGNEVNLHLGVGGNAMAEIHFSKAVYFSAGTGVFWDFYGWQKRSGNNTKPPRNDSFISNKNQYFVFQPRVGLGFHF
ncbi:MAG: hypothetical protein IJR49_04660 [Treponema sp.]|nr:hypothetical protein [Treponema sp.]